MIVSNARVYLQPNQTRNKDNKTIFERLFGSLEDLFFPENEMVYEVIVVPAIEECFKLYIDMIDCRVLAREGGKKVKAACLFDSTNHRFVTDNPDIRCEVRMDKLGAYTLRVITELSMVRVQTQLLGAAGIGICNEYLIAA